MKNNPLTIGIIAVITPIPLFFLTAIWAWLMYFGIGQSLLNYETTPTWLVVCSFLPLLISPMLCIYGILQGIKNNQVHRAGLGILLSVLGLVENILFYCFVIYLARSF